MRQPGGRRNEAVALRNATPKALGPSSGECWRGPDPRGIGSLTRKAARPASEEQTFVDDRKYVPVMLGEYWVYLPALANSAVIAALLYTREGPIHFGIW